MVPRYSRPEMTAIWTPEARFAIWFEIEAHATDALAELGVVPKSAAKALWDWWATKPVIDVAAIDAIEAVTKHDVIAFLTWVAEQVGDEARFMHQGMTSSDVLDTCLAVQLARASDLLLADLDTLMAAIKRRAFEHKLTPTIGRSHGIHAELVERPCDAQGIAVALEDTAQSLHADWIVMGAYGKGRFREAMFGGVTQKLLDLGRFPLLLSH